MKSADSLHPNIFSFDDYRAFLRASYQFRKSKSAGFSFRVFSRVAGFSSPNFLKLVMEGQRNLSLESILKISKALQLPKDQTAFFEKLVTFNQSESEDARAAALRDMMKFKGYRDIKQMEADQFEFYSKWYYSAVRELVTVEGFQEDSQWIASRVFPKISAKEASDALELLLRLRLLKRGKDQKLQQAEALISTGAEVKNLAVREYHRQMLERAADSMETVPSEQRDLSAVTLGVRKDQVSRLKEKIRQFRKELLVEVGSQSTKNQEIYQLTVQLFPLSGETKNQKGGRS